MPNDVTLQKDTLIIVSYVALLNSSNIVSWRTMMQTNCPANATSASSYGNKYNAFCGLFLLDFSLARNTEAFEAVQGFVQIRGPAKLAFNFNLRLQESDLEQASVGN